MNQFNACEKTCPYLSCPAAQDTELKKHWCGCLGLCEEVEEIVIQKKDDSLLFRY